MAITLNHTIVPAYDKEVAARLFAQLFGLTYKGAGEHFAPRQHCDGEAHDLSGIVPDGSGFNWLYTVACKPGPTIEAACWSH
jgi:hypothetical protein